MTLKSKAIILNTSTTVCIINSILYIILFAIFPDLKNTSHVILFSISLLVLIGSLFVYLFFNKSVPSEVILYIVFLLCLSMQSIRIIEPVIEFKTFMVPIFIGRISLFFKYLGLLSLLGASLFSYSIKKQKIGSWILLSIFTSVVLSSIVHFNTGIIEKNLLPKIIFNIEELVITISIMIITVATFVKSGFDAKNRDYILLGISSFALILGLILTFTILTIMSGFFIIILLILGSILYLKSMHNITLWG